MFRKFFSRLFDTKTPPAVREDIQPDPKYPASSSDTQCKTWLSPFETVPTDHPSALLLKFMSIASTDLKFLSRAEGCDICAFSVPGTLAETVWTALRAKFDTSHLWPLILGGNSVSLRNIRDTCVESLDEYDRFEVQYEHAKQISAEDWMKQQTETDGWTNLYEENLRGDDTKERRHDGLHTLGRDNVPFVIMAMVPAKDPWEVPIRMKIGGWNACPEPATHAVMYKYWHKRYGVDLICYTSDVLEFKNPNPPKTLQEAMPLAREQFIYCQDIVTQGVGYIDALAAGLVNNPYWFFWWD